jgi:hypothetical protein
MTPDQQRLIDAAAEAYEAALVKGAANPYIPALEAAVTVALKAAVEVATENADVAQKTIDWNRSSGNGHIGIAYEAHVATKIGEMYADAISSLIPAQEKTNDA